MQRNLFPKSFNQNHKISGVHLLLSLLHTAFIQNHKNVYASFYTTLLSFCDTLSFLDLSLAINWAASLPPYSILSPSITKLSITQNSTLSVLLSLSSQFSNTSLLPNSPSSFLPFLCLKSSIVFFLFPINCFYLSLFISINIVILNVIFASSGSLSSINVSKILYSYFLYWIPFSVSSSSAFTASFSS